MLPLPDGKRGDHGLQLLLELGHGRLRAAPAPSRGASRTPRVPARRRRASAASPSPTGVFTTAMPRFLASRSISSKARSWRLLQLLLEQLLARDELLALEGRRDGRPQLFQQGVHVLAERSALAGREPQGPGPLAVFEVVHVAPVRGRLLGHGALFQELLNQAVLAEARRTEGEQVVALPAHPHAEADGLDRPLLADRAGQLGQLGGGLEGELLRVAAPEQLRNGQGLDHGHSRSLR